MRCVGATDGQVENLSEVSSCSVNMDPVNPVDWISVR